MIDLHSHILPGIDDGAQNMEEALEMARIAEQDGVKKIVSTPHVFRYPFNHRDLSVIEKKRKELTWVLKENGIHVDVLSGAEVHICHDLMDKIKRNREILVINQGSYMLVEFPPHNVFSGVIQLFFDLLNERITPIISHPERNLIFMRSPEVLFKLIQMGGLCQANSGSFLGYYGRKAMNAVYYFLDLDFIHFVASDCHKPHSEETSLSEAALRIQDAGGEEKARALFIQNPLAVLSNREIPYIPEPINPQKEERSLKVKVPNIFRRRD